MVVEVGVVTVLGAGGCVWPGIVGVVVLGVGLVIVLGVVRKVVTELASASAKIIIDQMLVCSEPGVLSRVGKCIGKNHHNSNPRGQLTRVSLPNLAPHLFTWVLSPFHLGREHSMATTYNVLQLVCATLAALHPYHLTSTHFYVVHSSMGSHHFL